MWAIIGYNVVKITILILVACYLLFIQTIRLCNSIVKELSVTGSSRAELPHFMFHTKHRF